MCCKVFGNFFLPYFLTAVLQKNYVTKRWLLYKLGTVLTFLDQWQCVKLQ